MWKWASWIYIDIAQYLGWIAAATKLHGRFHLELGCMSEPVQMRHVYD
jgi:hypothetical protein